MALYFAVENEGDKERFDIDFGDVELSCDGGNLDAGVSAGEEGSRMVSSLSISHSAFARRRPPAHAL